MTAAIDPTAVLATGTTPAQGSPAAAEGSAPTGEQQLFDYFVQSHLDAAPAQAAHLASPGALTGEIASDMAGFVKRSHEFNDFVRKQTSSSSSSGASMSGNTSLSDATSGGQHGLRPGPAQQTLGQPDSDPSGRLAPESLSGMLDRVVANVHQSQVFHIWTSLVARGAAEIPRTVNTLLKSQ